MCSLSFSFFLSYIYINCCVFQYFLVDFKETCSAMWIKGLMSDYFDFNEE